jgi:hypothetical protein
MTLSFVKQPRLVSCLCMLVFFVRWTRRVDEHITRTEDYGHPSQPHSFSTLYGFKATCFVTYSKSHHQTERIRKKNYYVNRVVLLHIIHISVEITEYIFSDLIIFSLSYSYDICKFDISATYTDDVKKRNAIYITILMVFYQPDDDFFFMNRNMLH